MCPGYSMEYATFTITGLATDGSTNSEGPSFTSLLLHPDVHLHTQTHWTPTPGQMDTLHIDSCMQATTSVWLARSSKQGSVE